MYAKGTFRPSFDRLKGAGSMVLSFFAGHYFALRREKMSYKAEEICGLRV